MLTVREVWDRGWQPLPLFAVNRPAIGWHYLMDGERDVRGYREWVTKGYRWWGVVTGKQVMVVDVDRKDERLMKVLADQGVREGECSFVVETERGMHFYYEGYGDGAEVDKVTGLWEGVDFIAKGGMVNLICPKRRIIRDTGELTPLPKEVLYRVAARARQRKERLAKSDREKQGMLGRGESQRQRYALSKLAGLRLVPPGRRNVAMNAVAWQLRGLVDHDWLEEKLWEVGEKIGLEDREIRATIRSGLKKTR